MFNRVLVICLLSVSYLPFIHASPAKIVSLMNKERGILGLNSITYNNTLESDLAIFNVKLDNPVNWYFETSTEYSYKYVLMSNSRRWKGDFIIELPEFSKYKKDGWTWIFRDRTFRTISYIINMRENQRSCFNFNQCNTTGFYDYMTCLKSFPVIPSVAYEKCSWAYQYYPKMNHKYLKQIACTKIYYDAKKPSPNYEKGPTKPMAFFCYGKFSNTTFMDNDLFVNEQTKKPTSSTKIPTFFPTKNPTKIPSKFPTKLPTSYPTSYPAKNKKYTF